MKLNEDYIIVNHPSLTDHSSVEVMDGPFLGVVYTYNKVSMSTEDYGGEDRLRINYSYDIVAQPTRLNEDLKNNKDFTNTINEILGSILEDNPGMVGKIVPKE